MKPLKDDIKNELANRFGLDSTELVFLAGGREDSDGVVFTTNKDGKKLVFKISQASDEMHVKNILEYAHYLGSRGIRISSPIKNENGNIYEVAKDYPIWKNVCESDERFGFEAEIDFFIEMSPNDYIKSKWLEMKERQKAFPINRYIHHHLRGMRDEELHIFE